VASRRTAARKKKEEEPGDPLEAQVRTLQRLIALSIVQGKNQADGIRLLDRTGMPATEIARVVDTTPNAVHARLGEAKRGKKK
jgi:hypothetical protein